MKVYIVDNGGQWTHREWRVVRNLGADVSIVPNTTPFSKISDADRLILSGGAPSVATDADRMGNNGEYLDLAECPVLGICAGMQFMCEHFGGVLGPGDDPEYGGVDLRITDHGDIFAGMPDRISVWASHNDEVKKVPADFEVIANSEACSVEAVRFAERRFFGVQFHPEVENTQYGAEMIRNFLAL